MCTRVSGCLRWPRRAARVIRQFYRYSWHLPTRARIQVYFLYFVLTILELVEDRINKNYACYIILTPFQLNLQYLKLSLPIPQIDLLIISFRKIYATCFVAHVTISTQYIFIQMLKKVDVSQLSFHSGQEYFKSLIFDKDNKLAGSNNTRSHQNYNCI